MSPESSEIEILQSRCDLIKKLYISDKVISANKKSSVFNWFLEQFRIFQENGNTSSYKYELLWKTFLEILAIEKSQNSIHRILIKSSSVINLLKAVRNYSFSNSWSSVILSCVSTFLQTSTVNSVLIADVNTLFELLIATLRIISQVKCNCTDEPSLKEAKILANVILGILENLPASTNEDKVLLLTKSLQDLAIFIHIAESDQELHCLSEKLAMKIMDVVLNIKKNKSEKLTSSVVESYLEQPSLVVANFFNSLQKLLASEDIVFSSIPINTATGTLMKKLLLTFLTQNKNTFYSLKVMAFFFAISGLDIPITLEKKSCCQFLLKEGGVSVVGLSHLLEACSAVPQCYMNAPVPDKCLKPALWFSSVATALLDIKITKQKALWLKCLCSLLKISPSIIESDILQLIKIAILRISVHSKESKKQYCELFDTVLQAHSKLHQVPKFFVKLLLALTECIKENSGGNLLINGQLLPQAQESIGKCVQELPYGQMTELWKIFIETFSTLENMCQVFNVSKGYILFVAQIFSTFLLHAQLFQGNIPTNVQSQFSKLIESTCEEIKNISAFTEKEAKMVPLQSAVLLLYYAIGELKLLYNCNHGNLPDLSKVSLSEEIFDFSILHDSLDIEKSSYLEAFMNCDNKILSFLVFQLVLQKVRALYIYSKSSESSTGEDTHGIQKSIAFILKFLQESCSSSDSWDMDICAINSTNYGSACWKVFLKISPFMFYHLNWKDIYVFCSSAQNIIMQNDEHENGAKSFILSTLESREFQEFKDFQTAFVSAIWSKENLLFCKKRSFEVMETEQSPIDKIFTLLNMYTSKSLKYAQRTPKSKKSGNLWKDIKEISDVLNLILSSESLPKDKLNLKNTSDVVKLLSYLPLECVLPGNQMKCIIGLSLLFFLVPQSCKSDTAITLTREISQQLLTIFDGARSIWLFDFVNSGPYLKFIVKTIESVISHESERDNEWAVDLLECVISLAVRYVESLQDMKSYLLELIVKSSCSTSALITLYALLKKFAQVLPKNQKQGNYKETLIALSTLAVQCFMKQMNSNFKDGINDVDHYYFIGCYMQSIEIVFGCSESQTIGNESLKLLPKVLEKALDIVQRSCLDTLHDAYLLLLSKICKHSSKLSAFLPDNFISISWKIVLSHFEEKRKKTIEHFPANVNHKNSPAATSCVSDGILCVLCSFYTGQLSTEDFKKNFLLPLTLNYFEEESLKELSVATPPGILPEVFHTLTEEMNCLSSATKDVFSLQLSLLMLRSVIDANSDKCAQPVFSNLLQKCLPQLNCIVNQACNSYICETMVIIPVLDFIDFIVKGERGLPEEVLLQSLHSIAPLSLEVQDYNYDLFIKSYSAVWKVVYDLFMHHTSVVISCQAPFLYYVSKLLKSIVKAGAAEPLSKCDASVFQQVQLCAQNMNRLLTVIARSEHEFSKLVPYLVADYVDTVQHITLESSVKEAILSGIFRLLDICSEQSIKMLAVNINYVCREIYTNLVNYYRQNKKIS